MKQIACIFNRHQPPDRRANWTGEAFVSRCAYCHKPIRRIGKGHWRRDDSAKDQL